MYFRFKREEILEMRIKRYDKDVLEKTLVLNDLQKRLNTLKESYEKENEKLLQQEATWR